MKIRALSKREKLIVYAAAAVLVFGAAFNVLSEAFSKAARLNKEIETKKSSLLSSLRLINEREKIISLYEKYKDIFEGKKSLEEAETSLFQEVKTLALGRGLIIERVSSLPARIKEGHGKVFLEVEMSGGLKSIFSFVNELEGLERFIEILSLSLYPQSDFSLRCRITFSRIFFS